jgi:RNA-binding protein YhbY
MQRVDLYIKVEVVLNDEEKPERVAGEICRQVEKIYVVRSAELSNLVVRD